MDDNLAAAFLAECDEALVDLNNATLALEADPTDQAAMDELFRRAHTLKGNFAAMGFAEPAGVAHAVEDLLDAVRGGHLTVTPERMDLVFDGLDAIESAVAEIRDVGTATTEHTALVEALRAAATETDGPTAGPDPTATAGGAAPSAPGDADPNAASAAVPEGARYRVHVTLREGGMPALDAALFLDAVPDDLPLVATDPDETALCEGEFEGGFDLYVGSAAAPETLAATLGGLWACEGATVTDLGAAPTSAAGDETEVAGDVTGSDASTDATDASDDAGDAGDAPTTDAETAPTRQPKSGPSTEVRAIRVDVDQLDGLYELVEQLVTTRIKLRRALDADRRRGALEQLNELEKTSANLQNSVMRMRLIPLSKVFDKFPRLVRDLSRAQDKRVEFRVEGGDVELDRTILDALGDPVMHLLRNAVDHGIESPAEREAAGKPPAGSVELRATRENDRVLITLRDDGKGLDPERIRQKAVERGLVTAEEAALLPDERVFDFVFEAGFSTAEQVTDVSGRGVGMDAVRTAVAALDGSVALASTPGEGTLVTVRLPVSVAIVKVLLVRVGDAEYGVPVDQVAEIRQCEGLDTISGHEVYSRGETLEPVVRLRDVLAAPGEPTDEGMLVRISPEERAVVLHCDAVLQQEEVVVKPFRGALEGVPGMGGAAVVGEGDIVPILDVATLPLVGGVALPDETDLERAVTEEVTA